MRIYLRYVLSIGIAYSNAGAIVFTVRGVTIQLSGLAVGALVGIFMNAVLDYPAAGTPLPFPYACDIFR
mgnify:CR=1 FL=1